MHNPQFLKIIFKKYKNGLFKSDFKEVCFLVVVCYDGLNWVDLRERNKYGYESLIKAVNQVLDKLNLENRTLTEITYKQRKEQRPWNAVALREAVINAFVHYDYTRETAPKFEIFDDRLEITSHGGLPESLSKEDFSKDLPFPATRN